MAKKSAIQKNLNKEKQVKKNKSRRDRLKAICSNKSLPMEQRFEAQLKLSEMPRPVIHWLSPEAMAVRPSSEAAIFNVIRP